MWLDTLTITSCNPAHFVSVDPVFGAEQLVEHGHLLWQLGLIKGCFAGRCFHFGEFVLMGEDAFPARLPAFGVPQEAFEPGIVIGGRNFGN